MENRVTVSTPEHVQLEFETAGIGSRAVSLLIDWLIIGTVNGVLLLVAIFFSAYSASVGNPFWSSVTLAIFLFLFFFLPFCYYTLTETFLHGQTIGKKAMSLRVVTDRGTAPGFLGIVLRNLLRVIDSLPFLYLTGLLTVFFNGREKRLGDLAAGTMVVRKESVEMPQVQPLFQHTTPPIPLDHRITLDDREWALLGRFLTRREEVFPEARKKLSKDLAHAFLPAGMVKEGREEFYLEAVYLQLKQQTKHSAIEGTIHDNTGEKR
mgnify:CR=1 FL=1